MVLFLLSHRLDRVELGVGQVVTPQVSIAFLISAGTSLQCLRHIFREGRTLMGQPLAMHS
jgi:hypothetical protein